ncbi:MAG TPA: hypothetical protein VF713_25010 [Thermoanaerobaculia bacterium]
MIQTKGADMDIKLHVGLTRNGNTERHVLYRRMPKAAFDGMSTAQIDALMNGQLPDISLDKPSTVYGAIVKYGYVDPSTLPASSYGDTLIQATLPYCLHVPNGAWFEVHVPEQGYSALVTLKKVWTAKAQGSSGADFEHDTLPTYFTNNNLRTPQFPIDPSLGWEQDYSGRNVEKINDSNGVFRYTNVFVELTTGISVEQLEVDGTEKKILLGELSLKVIEVMNRLLDTYRYVTHESYVERVGSLNVHNIFFPKENTGFYVMSMLGAGITNATMNLPRTITGEIERMLKADERPQLAELLQLDAESSLEKRAYTLAMVKSFQALEVLLEKYLLSSYQVAGLSESDALRVLDRKWRTPERLKQVLRDVSGQSASEMPWWQEWIGLYDSARNEVLHQGKEPSAAEAARVVALNSDVLTWLKQLPVATTGIPLARKLLTQNRSLWKRVASGLRSIWQRLKR